MNFEAVLYYKNQQNGGNGDGSVCKTPPPTQTSSVSRLLPHKFYGVRGHTTLNFSILCLNLNAIATNNVSR